MQQVARGCDAVLHFQWRAAIGGAEKWHSAMLPHAGPRTRTWRDVVALGAELESLRAAGRCPHRRRRRHRARLVLLVGPRARLPTVDLAVDGLDPAVVVRATVAPRLLHRLRPPRVGPERLLARAGPPAVLRHRFGAQRIIEAARRGSSVAIGYFSGAVDERDRVRAGGYPAPWQDLLGLWIEEYRPLLPGSGHRARADAGLPPAHAVGWSEHLHSTARSPSSPTPGGDLEGCAAVTRRTLGAADPPGTSPRGSTPTDRVAAAPHRRESDASPVLASPPPAGIEVALRETDDARYLFLLNHGRQAQSVDLDTAEGSSWRRALDG